jgi:4-amino-4-deoxy-L-arabinose transferase-like glycosyltransferase
MPDDARVSQAPPVRSRFRTLAAHLIFFIVFLAVLIALHAGLLDLPYFWDEMGQFVPAALDIYNELAFVPRSTTPNVHPPGVMAYLAGFWKIFGYSVVNTRIAMLLLAALGMLFTFMLAVRVCRPLGGVPAFTAVLLLACAPIFYTQSMMAQLDMPAMVLTMLALLLFIDKRYAASAAVSVLLVLMKETAITTPAVFGAWLLWEQRYRHALYFLLPAVALAGWLAWLGSVTGHIFGNREFTHYNIAFQLHPVRLPMTLIRRLFYVFVDNFHWIGTIAIIAAFRRTGIFRSRTWVLIGAVFIAQLLMVTVLGGAALERYLMPVLPLFYIGVAAALTTIKTSIRRFATAAMAAGLAASLFIPSPFPYPFENSFALVDFVKLQKEGASFVESNYPDQTIASAWPFPDALRRPEFGFVSRPLAVKGLDNFNLATVLALKNAPPGVLVLYSRTWEASRSVVRLGFSRRFLGKYYFYEPQITREQVEAELGMIRVARFERRGQWLEVYASPRMPNVMVLF